MKRASHLFEAILERENFRIAFSKAVAGKRDRTDARIFANDLEANLRNLALSVRNDSVVLGQSRQFTIFDPKERLITAPCFRERVLHHAIMNVCEPVFERWLISDTFACRRGKGRVAAVRRAVDFAALCQFLFGLA